MRYLCSGAVRPAVTFCSRSLLCSLCRGPQAVLQEPYCKAVRQQRMLTCPHSLLGEGAEHEVGLQQLLQMLSLHTI